MESIKVYRFQKCLGIATCFVLMTFLNACAYRLGTADRSLPGKAQRASIPVFKNKSQEVGIEVAFTNNLIQEFQRSRIARITDKRDSDVIIEGTITSVDYLAGGPRTSGDAAVPYLPNGAVIATEYRVLVKVSVRVVRTADGLELWQGAFSGESTYSAPQVTLIGVNSVNPLYNVSARRQNIESLALTTMSEAHDRITENF